MKLKGVSSGNSRLVFFAALLFFLTNFFFVGNFAAGADKEYLAKKVAVKSGNRSQVLRRAGRYAEVEIVLGEGLTRADIASLPMAPGSDLEILQGGRAVKLQIPMHEVRVLIERGIDVVVLRKFILLKGSKDEAEIAQDDIITQGSCSDYCYDSNSSYVPIPDDGYDGEWAYSDISISCAGSGDIVCSMDVHYEIGHTWIEDLLVIVSDYYVTDFHILWFYEGGDGDDISETETGITAFNGFTANQIWTLSATDDVAGDWGYIDYWWIKVYYEESSGPENDDCADAITVTENVPYFGSSVGATGSYVSNCSDGDTADVWHKFTPSVSGNYTISLRDSGFDTTLAVFDYCGGPELACNDDTPPGLQSELTINLTAGNTYYIRVAGWEGATGSYKLLVEGCSTPPVNDDCADAIGVVADVVYNGSTECAAGSYVSTCSDGDTADVWHSFTPAETGVFTISLAGSSFDTTLSVFDGCDGNELACNDDISYPDNVNSEVTVGLTGGSTYYIRVAGFSGATGDYGLAVTSVCMAPSEAVFPVPPNDACDVPLDAVLSWNNGSVVLKAVSYSKIPEEPILPKVIYGEDDRLDEYDVSNSAIRAIGDSTVALVDKGALWDNGDGTFTLDYEIYGDCMGLCWDEPFRDQPACMVHCSGFLVGPDVIATAGHCSEVSYEDTAVIFGYVMFDESTPRLIFDSSEIYYCSDVIKQTGDSDWALMRLDRPVTGHEPLSIRGSGMVAEGEPLLVVGHPIGLPRKYAAGAIVQDSNPAAPYFQANLDTYMGNSGSPVFNANTLVVEGILVRGNEDFVWEGDCYRSNVCPDSGCPTWEDITRITELSDFLAVEYDVYFGLDNPPSELICSDIDTPMCEPAGLLSPCQTYYWQVVSKGFCDVNEGPVWSFTTGTFAADFDASCVVDGNDLWILFDQWLLEPLSADLSPVERDGSVDFLDWTRFADSWQSVPSSPHWDQRCDIAPEGGDGVVDERDAGAFVEQWLQLGEYGADIAPEGGDGIVNMLDFALLGDEWLAGTE